MNKRWIYNSPSILRVGTRDGQCEVVTLRVVRSSRWVAGPSSLTWHDVTRRVNRHKGACLVSRPYDLGLCSPHSISGALPDHPRSGTGCPKPPSTARGWIVQFSLRRWSAIPVNGNRGRPCREWMDDIMSAGVRLDYKSWTVWPKIAEDGNSLQDKQWTPTGAGPMVPWFLMKK